MHDHPQKFRRLKGNFKNSGTLHKDLLESSVGKVLGGYVIDPTAKQVYIGLVEQKDRKYSETLKFLSHITLEIKRKFGKLRN